MDKRQGWAERGRHMEEQAGFRNFLNPVFLTVYPTKARK